MLLAISKWLLCCWVSVSLIDQVAFVSAASNLDCNATSSQYFRLSLDADGTRNIITYLDFTNFMQLKMACDFRTFVDASENKSSFFRVWLLFDKMGIINQTIDLSGYSAAALYFSYFSLIHVKGFDLAMSGQLIRFFDLAISSARLGFYNSEISFYYRGTLIDEKLCNTNILKEANIRLFEGLYDATVEFSTNSAYKNPICPYVFKNADIKELVFDNIQLNRINSVSLSFLKVPNENSEQPDLRCNINQLTFYYVYRMPLDFNLIEPLIFRNISVLTIDGTIETIHDDLFKALTCLKSFRLELNNLRSFFH